MSTRVRRRKSDIFEEIHEFCLTPQKRTDICRTINLRAEYIHKAVDAGIIEKVGEIQGWSGPPAHVYQSIVHKVTNKEDEQ